MNNKKLKETGNIMKGFSEHFEKNGLIRSQHTGEILEWIDMFLESDKRILQLIVPVRFGKTSICKELISYLKDEVTYNSYCENIYHPSSKVSIYDDMLKNRLDAESSINNIKIAEKIMIDTSEKIICISSQWNNADYTVLVNTFISDVQTVKFPVSRYPFPERYSQDYLKDQKNSIGKRLFKYLWECGE